MARPLTQPKSGTVVPVQSVPISCPVWCAGGHLAPDPDHYGAWLHESVPRTVDVEDHTGTVLVSVSRFDELELPQPANIGETMVTLAFALDDHHAEYGLTFEQAHMLLGALLDLINETLPPEEQTFIGPPGFEYARDCEW